MENSKKKKDKCEYKQPIDRVTYCVCVKRPLLTKSTSRKRSEQRENDRCRPFSRGKIESFRPTTREVLCHYIVVP